MAGSKVDNGEKLRRVRYVAEYIIKGYAVTDICQNMSNKWGVSDRQVRRYVQDAWALIQEELVEDLQKIKSFHVKVRIDRYNKISKELDRLYSDRKKDWKDRISAISTLETRILDILKDLGKIETLYVDKHEVGGLDGKPLEIIVKETFVGDNL